MEKQFIVELITKGQIMIPRLLLESYHHIGLNEEECVLLMHLFTSINEGNTFPTPDELSKRMSCTSAQCSEHLRHLIQRGILEIVQDLGGPVYSERYSLDHLWEKLADHYILTQKNEEQLEKEEN